MDSTKTDYKQKYLNSFFNWQNICTLKDKKIKELEDKIKRIETKQTADETE